MIYRLFLTIIDRTLTDCRFRGTAFLSVPNTRLLKLTSAVTMTASVVPDLASLLRGPVHLLAVMPQWMLPTGHSPDDTSSASPNTLRLGIFCPFGAQIRGWPFRHVITPHPSLRDEEFTRFFLQISRVLLSKCVQTSGGECPLLSQPNPNPGHSGHSQRPEQWTLRIPSSRSSRRACLWRLNLSQSIPMSPSTRGTITREIPPSRTEVPKRGFR